jgi:[protein-PII] uridylyltransferase
VFYVTDLTGHKIEGKARQKKIREALLEVFHRRVEEDRPMPKVAAG